MINTDYLTVANKIKPKDLRMKHIDHLPAVCFENGTERWVSNAIWSIGPVAEVMNNAPVGTQLKLYFNSSDAKEEFRRRINSLECEYYKVINPDTSISESGFYYYISPTEDESLIKIEDSPDNKLNAVVTRVSMKELMSIMEEDCIKLNEIMGDKPMLSRFTEYLDRYNQLVDNAAFE